MTITSPVFDKATVAQLVAVDPSVSAWVTANAGTGKTRVLTDRVARMLVNGIRPEQILCITYTKAAATEMNRRLEQKFSEWTMMPDERLRHELLRLGIGKRDISRDMLRFSRTLLTRLVENSGGINITTVHSFASELLRRFPLEAGVSPGFTVIEDRDRNKLVRTVLNELARARPDIIAETSRFTSHSGFEELANRIITERRAFNSEECRLLGEYLSRSGLARPLEPGFVTGQNLGRLVDDFNGWDETSYREAFRTEHISLLASLTAILVQGSKTEIDRANTLFRCLEQQDESALAGLYKVFLGRRGFANKLTIEAMGTELAGGLQSYAGLLKQMQQRQNAGLTASRTFACHRLAVELLSRLDAYQESSSNLYFHDLLIHSHDLLSNPEIADWVLYRLDSTIDHILVDEAQDMNDSNWDIVNCLSAEFTSGAGQHDGKCRTVFAVGDQKQSIFGFQGANPARFSHMQDHYSEQSAQIGKDLVKTELVHSFRSSQAILDVVQRTFASISASGFEGDIPHRAYDENLAGRVDLLSFRSLPSASQSDRTLFDPDNIGAEPSDHHSEYARDIVKVLGTVLESTIPGENGPRRARPGDILILVQTRSDIYESLIRELNRSNLPFSGTDRLKMPELLIVKDILAVLSFLALGDDDHSLACVLKSPLLGFTDDELMDLAIGRKQTLFEQLVERVDTSVKCSRAVGMIRDLQGMRNGNNPYDVIERVLSIHDGMKMFVSRLGNEVGEAMDVLLDQALEYEKTGVPSLTGFIEWLDLDSLEFSRKIRQDSDEIRVMTVHGAKGLEAPIVILPETHSKPLSMTKGLYQCPDGLPIWLEKPLLENTGYMDIWDAEERALAEEKLCLLYVAMTRSKYWMIACGAGKMVTSGKPPGTQWHVTMNEAMKMLRTETISYPLSDGKDDDAVWPAERYEYGDWPASSDSDETRATSPPEALPALLDAKVAEPAASPRTISPSASGEADHADTGPASASGMSALTRGTLLHLLLEHLPLLDRGSWHAAAERLMSMSEPELPSDLREEVYRKSVWILEKPDLAHLFTPDALSEVPVTARMPEGIDLPMYGIIDKLVIRDKKVIAVDYKSHGSPPEDPASIPRGILRQMGYYQWALEGIYRDSEVILAVLWTENGNLMTIPGVMTREALAEHLREMRLN